jgi:DNA primase
VQPGWDGGRWWCRRCSGSDHWGDVVDYVARRDNLTLGEAARSLDGMAFPPRHPDPAPNRPAAWSAHLVTLVSGAQRALWSPAGERARAWLAGRGLSEDTIRRAGLGYLPADGRDGPWYLRRGITIPMLGVDGHCYGVRIRRPVPRDSRGTSKYISVAGTTLPLYGIRRGSPVALITEGYYDCLLAAQHLPEIDVLTMNLCRPDGEWLPYLLSYRWLVVCLDGDEAGAAGWARWAGLGTARRVTLPAGKDITQFVVDHGGDLGAWWQETLASVSAAVPAADGEDVPPGAEMDPEPEEPPWLDDDDEEWF